MDIGVIYPQTELGGDPDAVRAIGTATERLGYDYLLAYDHVVGAPHDGRTPPLRGPYTDADPFHDPFVLFAYLAGMTDRIGFATGVLILPQRQTVLVAKQAADLDLLSGERLRLGVGVGWNYVEYDALGQDFSTRGARADEQIGVLRRLWTEQLVAFDGRFDRVDRGALVPRPKRPIPIWIGGFSDAAFARGARTGDGFMFAGGLQRAVDAMDRIEQFAADAGRELGTFGKELVLNAPGGVSDTIEQIERWREVGGTHVAVGTMNMGLDSLDAHLDFIAEVSAAR